MFRESDMSILAKVVGSSIGKSFIGAAFAVCTMAASASAALLGSSVGVDFKSDFFSCGAVNVVVGAGTEVPAGCPGFSQVAVDITDTQVIITHTNTAGWAAGSFTGVILDILSGPTITSLSYNIAASTMANTGLSFTGSQMKLNFAGLFGPTAVGVAVFDVRTASAVPVPAALPLLATGLGALGFVARRRKAKAA